MHRLRKLIACIHRSAVGLCLIKEGDLAAHFCRQVAKMRDARVAAVVFIDSVRLVDLDRILRVVGRARQRIEANVAAILAHDAVVGVAWLADQIVQLHDALETLSTKTKHNYAQGSMVNVIFTNNAKY